VRLCCGCQKRMDQSELIRLQIGSSGFLEPVTNHNTGRSAWVCFNEQCIQAIIRHPKKLFRSLRTHAKTEHLSLKIIHWLWKQIRQSLLQIHRDGCIIQHQNQDTHTIYTTHPHTDFEELRTIEPKFMSLKSDTHTPHCSIFLAPHKRVYALRRNIQLYAALYTNGIENMTS